MSLGEFAGSFLSAFNNAKIQKQQLDQDAKEKKAHLTLFELELDRQKAAQRAAQEQGDAQTQLFQRLQGTPQVGPPGNMVSQPGTPPVSLTDILADPQNAALLLKSGLLKGDDLLRQGEQTANRNFTQGLVDRAGAGGGGGMEFQGFDVGPGGVAQPKFGLPAITTQTVQTPNGPRIRTIESRTGRVLSELGAPQEQDLNPTDAGKIQNLNQGVVVAKQLQDAFINPDGSVNRAEVFKTFGNPVGGGIPFTSGRQNASRFDQVKDAILRVTSGAGLSGGDVDSIVKQFQPQLFDSDEAIKDKVGRLGSFLNGSFDAAGIPDSIRAKLIKSRGSQGQQSGGSSGGRVIDFHELPKK